MQNIQSARYAIIDTSVLIALYSTNMLHYLSLFYLQVRVPRAVEKEFLEKLNDEIERSVRFDFLLKFYEKNGTWFLRCNEYGQDLVDIYLTDKNLDLGEAELFAQNQALGSIGELLLDEKPGRAIAKSESIKHHGVLYILARLELSFGICNYYEVVKKLQKLRIGKFSNSIVTLVYEQLKQK